MNARGVALGEEFRGKGIKWVLILEDTPLNTEQIAACILVLLSILCGHPKPVGIGKGTPPPSRPCFSID